MEGNQKINWDIRFVVFGKPIALKRHRTFKKGDFTGSYDPSKGDKADFLSMALEHKPAIPFDEPLFVKLEFMFPRPKSHYRTGKNAHLLKDSAPERHIGTPDADNLAKFCLDSLNNVFWRDDSIVCELSVSKKYDKVPRIAVQVVRISKL